MSLEIYLIRHGQAQANGTGGDNCEPAITPEGLRQARQAGRALRKIRFLHLFASPMLRALETAREIARGQACRAEIRSELCEAFTPSHRPLFRQEIKKQFPRFNIRTLRCNAQGNWWTNRRLHEWNTVQRRALRMARLFKDLARRKNGAIGVILHNGIASILIDCLLEAPLRVEHRYTMQNCGITVLRLEKDGKTLLLYCNRTEHLYD